MLVALAALAATGARGVQVSTTKTHGRTPAAKALQTAHTASGRTNATSAHHAGASGAGAGRTHFSYSSGARRRESADEVGWRAGLAIRNQLARRRGARARPALRQVRLRRAYAAQNSSATDFDTPAAAPDDRTDGDRGGDGAAESSAADRTTRTLLDASASVQASAPVETAEEDAADRNLPPPTEAASVRSETETEEASLTIPHSLIPSPLRGSLESLTRQNAKLDAEGLERIEDESDLAARIANGLLVPVPASSGLAVNSDLPANHRYCRPWTARFLADLAKSHEATFHKPLEVSSAVRTVEYQRRLMRTNGNAAPAEGDIVSPHLTGATVDIAKSGLSRQEMAWMRQRLLTLQSEGKIDAEEEFRQACFHITVYRSYAAEHTPRSKRRAAPSAGDDAGATAGI